MDFDPTFGIQEPEKRILCVSHGGLIMEFLNFVDTFRAPGSYETGSRTNKAKNCAIFIFKITEAENEYGFHIECVVENNVDHL